MSKFNYKKLSALVVSLVILSPLLIYASSSGSTIKNPLGENNDSVEAILLNIMNLVTMIGSIVVVFFIIYSGYKFVMSGGNPGERDKAKDMFFATIIGGAILLGADVIANVVVNTVETTIKG